MNRKIGHKFFIKPRFLRLDCGVLSICFDDFPRTAWTIGGAILAQYGVHATYFASGAFCDKTYMGMEQFTETDLLEAQEAGHEIGCHTYDHYSALEVSTGEFERSIEKNREFLCERLNGEAPDSFAFPYNHVSLQSKLAVARQFKTARGVGTGVNLNWIDLSEVAGVNLSLTQAAGYSPNKPGFLDINELIEQAALQRKWLVVYTHDLADTPSMHGCRTHGLEELLIKAKQAGLAVKTLREVTAG
nr:polysaccharide deacetylase family protein [Microvirga mediterraneensis]